MKRSEIFFSVLLVPLDYVLVVLAGLTAYALRFTTFAETIPVTYELTFSSFLQIAVPASFVWVVVFASMGMYAMRYDGKARNEWLRVFLGSTAAVAIFIFIIFFRQELFASRFIILACWLISIFYVGFGRSIVRIIQFTLLRRGVGARHLILFTAQADPHNFATSFSRHPEFGFILERQFNEVTDDALQGILDLKKNNRCDDIILATTSLPQEQIQHLVQFCNEEHINFRYTADLLPVPLLHFEISTLAGIPVVELKRTPLDGWGKVWKRLFDFVFSVVAIILLSPIYLVVALIVKFTSQGPIFVSLARVGERGKIFSLFKFRSMVNNAEELKKKLLQYNERKDGPLFKMKDDPRITSFGRFIRKTSLDELPQFWNVIRGDMSVVGPRPHEPQEVAHYSSYQKKLLTIKPGITGMAQISGRSDLKFSEESELDIFYIENWNLLRDIRIIVRTISVVLFRKGSA